MSKENEISKRIMKANDLNYDELLKDIEEEKLYLMRLYQQGKNDYTNISKCPNEIEFNEEIQITRTIIKHKELLLRTLEQKNKNKRSFFK